MKHSLYLFTTVLLAVFGLAQAENVVTRYYANEVAFNPGLVELSPGYLTVMEFYDLVDNVASGKSELMTVTIDGSRIMLTTREQGGATDLVVIAGGNTMLFTVRVDPQGDAPRRYLIEEERSRPRIIASGSNTGEAVSRAPTRPAAPAPPAANPAAQTGLSLNYDPSGTLSNSGEQRVFFTFENGTGGTVALDPARLRVSQSGRLLTHVVRKDPLRSLVPPGASQAGFVTIENADPGTLSLVWTVVKIGPEGQAVALERNLDVAVTP